MIRRKSTSGDGGSRGFSFDLVSRRKGNKDEEGRKVRSPLELLTEKKAAPEEPIATETEAVDAAPAPAEEAELTAKVAELAAEPAPVEEQAEAAAPETAAPKTVVEESTLFLSEPVASTPEPAPAPEPVAEEAPAPAAPASARRTSRVKTTFLGFERSDGRIEDIFAGGQTDKEASSKNEVKFPVGWLVVTKGPGRGTQVSLQAGVSQIGRGEDQSVQLDYGDSGISRSNHAAIAFDDEEGKFFLGHGGKANIVRLNGKPVLSTEELSSGDEIRISETTLHFVALCNDDFTWADEE